MARRQYKTPFAATGDVESVPDAVQPDGSVSMQQGFGFDYQRDPDTDPLAKVFPRDVHNGILNEITASIGEIQQQGYPIWVTAGAPYPINAVVRHNDANWQSNIATNNDEPGVGAGATSWKVAGVSVDKFNAPIVTIASAANVNLTAGAPDTSQITISGSVAITGFTVAAGRAFVVKFSGACTLANSGTLVTGTGANIVTAAGDSCIIRATAANTVEVLGYVRATQSQSKAANGYKVLNDGTNNPIIIQWATVTAANSTSAQVVNFPIAFPNAAFQVVNQIDRIDDVAAYIASYSVISSLSPSSVTFRWTTNRRFIAIGY